MLQRQGPSQNNPFKTLGGPTFLGQSSRLSSRCILGQQRQSNAVQAATPLFLPNWFAEPPAPTSAAPHASGSWKTLHFRRLLPIPAASVYSSHATATNLREHGDRETLWHERGCKPRLAVWLTPLLCEPTQRLEPKWLRTNHSEHSVGGAMCATFIIQQYRLDNPTLFVR